MSAPITAPFELPAVELHGTQLIEASAGTGKTWTLCGLYLRLLLERGLQVRQILVVTFTNAACAELRERIRARLVATLAQLRGEFADADAAALLQRLRERRQLGDGQIGLRLQQARECFDEAAIFTIHGFCQRALADAPLSAGMPLAMELLADDGELRQQVVNDFWRRHVAGGEMPGALAAHLLAHGDTPRTLARLLARRQAKPLSRLVWPAGIDAPAAADLGSLAQAHASACRTWQAQRDAIVAIVEDAQPRLHKARYAIERIRDAAVQWDRLLADERPLPPLRERDKLSLFTSDALKPTGGQAAVTAHPFFAQAAELLQRRRQVDGRLDAARARLLRTLLDEGAAALRRAKRERHVVAFDDMLYNLHQRLHGDAGAALAGALRQRFPAALIDEFQDTDPLQYAVFKAIYGAHRDTALFLVGDPKQAIYSFRNADLHTYLRARADAAARWTLRDHQRAVRPLLQGLNALFAANPRAFVFETLPFEPACFGARPRPPLHDAGPARAALQLWQLPRDADGLPLPRAQARAAAFAACAGEIARLIDAGQRGGIRIGDRPLHAADIAVLVRSHADGARMRQALAAAGVGSVELSQASVFDSVDAEELQRVLAAMLGAAREPLLRAALATALMGCDAQDIDALADDEARWLSVLQRFADYRDAWRGQGIDVALRRWMQQEGVAARLLARADGERRLTNLLHLAECLHEAAVEHATPEALWRWLQAQRSEGRRDDAAQLRLESDRNLVPVVTVHRSKGLEYAFVFCPTLWDGRHAGGGDRGEGREYHDAGGAPVLDLRTRDGGEIGKAEADAIDAQRRLESAAETLRLIYVALTRAEQRCTLVVGSYANPTRNGPSTRQAARSWLNWLVAGRSMTPQAWMKNALQPDDIDAAWAAFAQQHAPQVDLAPLPGAATVAPAAPAAPDAPAPLPELAARDAPAAVGSGWWIGSYSALAHGTRHDAAAGDHDLRVPLAPPEQSEQSAPIDGGDDSDRAGDDIVGFPRGSVAGECIHALFERIHFDDPRGWPAAAAAALLAHPLAAAPGAALQPMLLKMLDDVLHTPLWRDGAALSAVPRRHCLVELEFTLPAPGLDAQALAQLLHQQGYAVPALHFGRLHGYLRGFIDLVLRHRGRYYIVDWKSNHLGSAPRHYAADALAATMARQAYHLQYLLYGVALHRYLQRRVPGYRFDEHFGGVRYLFVRGVRPDWRDGQGRFAGVFAHRPSAETIQRLDALLGGGAP